MPDSALKRRRRRERKRLLRQWQTWAIVGVAVLAIALVGFALTHGRGSSADTLAAPPPASPTAAPLRTVGLGDSITQFNADVAHGVPGDSWFVQLTRLDPRLVYGYNAGVHGDTTAQMLARLDTDVLARKPAVVTIMGGTNDVGQGVPAATTLTNLRQIIERIKAAGARPVLATIPPRGDVRYAQPIRTLNAGIAALGRDLGVPVLDLYPVLATPAGVYQPGMSDDGIHPTAQGQRMLAQAAEQQMQAAGL